MFCLPEARRWVKTFGVADSEKVTWPGDFFWLVVTGTWLWFSILGIVIPSDKPIFFGSRILCLSRDVQSSWGWTPRRLVAVPVASAAAIRTANLSQPTIANYSQLSRNRDWELKDVKGIQQLLKKSSQLSAQGHCLWSKGCSPLAFEMLAILLAALIVQGAKYDWLVVWNIFYFSTYWE